MKHQIALGLLVGSAFALPGATPSSTPSATASATATASPMSMAAMAAKNGSVDMSEMCSNNDVDIWTKENYRSKGMTDWYNNWYMDNIKGDAQIDETFAGYWGLGPSFSCDVDNPCAAPQCSALKRPDQAQDYENAAMFLSSMANFNAYIGRIYEALDGSKIDFAAFQVPLQQKFYPGMTKTQMQKIQGMNGGLTALGLVGAWAQVLAPPINTMKEILGGVSRSLNPHLAGTDKSVANIKELADNFVDKVDAARGQFVKMHDDIIKWGTYEWTPIDAVFEDGAFVDDRQIAILHDLSVETVRDYVRKQLYATVISNAWVNQGAYIFSREMDEETCKEWAVTGFEDKPPHVCYQGRIYWLHKYLGGTVSHSTGVTTLPGYEDLEAEIGATLEDVILSSVDAYNEGGYLYNATEHVDSIFEGDIQKQIDQGSRLKGIWTVPVCEVENSEKFDNTGLQQDNYDSTSSYWSTIDRNLPKGKRKRGSKGIQICLCAFAKDRQGVSILELPSNDAASFRQLVGSKEFQNCEIPQLTF